VRPVSIIRDGQLTTLMNDSWNDPPEYPEVPECCGDTMDVTDDGVCICQTCGRRIEPQPDPDPALFADVELPDDFCDLT